MSELIFNKDVLKSNEGSYADKDFFKGDIVYSYRGCTYGCISNDGRPVTLKDGEGPFFEMPHDALSLNVPKSEGGS